MMTDGFLFWPWWVFGACGFFIAGACTILCATVLCNPCWGYHVPKRVTWPIGSVGLTCIGRGSLILADHRLTWGSLLATGVYAFAALVSAIYLVRLARQRPR